MRYIYYITTACTLLSTAMCGCSSKTETDDKAGHGEEEIEAWVPTEDFSLPAGMTAERASTFSGLRWNIDTLHGICVPDTLLLWADYDGKQYITNVTSLAGHPMKELKLSGNEKVEEGAWLLLEGMDFKPTAVIVDNPYGTLAKMREAKSTVFMKQTGDIVEMVRDFFVSSGSSEYMCRRLATRWENERKEALEYYEETINPFNNGYRASFAPDKINVTVTDASKGIVEVEAYATDRFTLGNPGWTYWTVEICREAEGYKIKEFPAIHRKFGDSE